MVWCTTTVEKTINVYYSDSLTQKYLVNNYSSFRFDILLFRNQNYCQSQAQKHIKRWIFTCTLLIYFIKQIYKTRQHQNNSYINKIFIHCVCLLGIFYVTLIIHILSKKYIFHLMDNFKEKTHDEGHYLSFILLSVRKGIFSTVLHEISICRAI